MNTKKALMPALFLLLALLIPGVAAALVLLDSDVMDTLIAERTAPEPAAPRAVLVLDPGHGGQDLGAVVAGRREKDIALSIARRLRERLEAEGAGSVRMTRDNDSFVPLDQRVDDSLEWSGSVFVSLHLNQVRYKTLSGITVYAFGKDHFKKAGKERHHRTYAPLPPPPKEMAKESARLAVSIVDSLRHRGLRVEAPAKAGFYVLKNPSIPSVLIELGYLSNPQEAARLIDPAYQEKLADALAASLRPYLVKLR